MINEFPQRRQAPTIDPGTAVLAGPTHRRRFIEARVQSQTGYEGNRLRQRLAEVQQVQDGVAAVSHQHQGTAGQPAPELQNHLTGPAGELLGSASPLPKIPFRGSQHRQERQGPIASGPRNMAQPHQTDPAQAADLDQIAPAGAHGITVNPAGADLGAAAPLHGFVDAEHQRAVALAEVPDQKTQQYVSHLEWRPCRPVEDVIIAGVVAASAQTHDAERRGHGALAGSEDRADQQDLGFPPGRGPKQCCEGIENG